MKIDPNTEALIALVKADPAGHEDMVRSIVGLRIRAQTESRGAQDLDAAVKSCTDGWTYARYLNLFFRGIRGGEFHKHEDLAADAGQSYSQCQRHWQAFYAVEFVPEPGQKAVRLFDADNMKYGNDGCLFRYDNDADFSEENLERVVDTNERRVSRHHENFWTSLRDLVLKSKVAESMRKRWRAKARDAANREAQTMLPIFEQKTGTDG
jgi:hypothetical protein